MICEKKWVVTECMYGRVLIIKGGIGKKSVYQCLEEITEKYAEIKIIFSVGIAGALSPSLHIGDIVVSNCIVDYSVDHPVEEHTSAWNIQREIQEKDFVYFGKTISSDTIVYDERDKQQLYSEYKGLCVEMESAGVIKVCNRKQIPFAAIKIISDYSNQKTFLTMLKTQDHVTDILGCYLKQLLTSFC